MSGKLAIIGLEGYGEKEKYWEFECSNVKYFTRQRDQEDISSTTAAVAIPRTQGR